MTSPEARVRALRGAATVVVVAVAAAALPSRLPAQSTTEAEDPASLVGRSTPEARPLAGLDLYVPHPPDPEAVALGRRIFFDPVLSRDSTLACASCHRPERAFASDRPNSVGVFGRRGTRNVPMIANRAWGRSFFWDGRIESLEEQVLQPIVAPAEMGMTVEEAVARLSGVPAYRAGFRSVFDREPDRSGLARALAAYVRSIRAGDSPFDRAMDGDRSALSDLERRGLELFQGPARCARCHSGSLLTDESFHNTGVAWTEGEAADSGRALVTGMTEDIGAFKTPSLREVTRTDPYMHDGSLATLEEVVEFYDGGGHANPHLDPLIRPLRLSNADKEALLAFLRTLEGRILEGPRHTPY